MNDFKGFNFENNSPKTDHFKDNIPSIPEIANLTSKQTFFHNFSLKSLFRKFNPETNALGPIKRGSSISEHINVLLSLILFIILVFLWFGGLPLFGVFDQLKNDVKEQTQIIDMENKNNLLLEALSQDQKNLSENIQKIYTAVPSGDERAESVISILEGMATSNRLIIEAIGIRAIPESQIYYDELIGLIDIYEYTFNIETELPNILSFIAALRSSLRLMDLMTLEIEDKGNGLYRAGFVVNAYSLVKHKSMSNLNNFN